MPGSPKPPHAFTQAQALVAAALAVTDAGTVSDEAAVVVVPRAAFMSLASAASAFRAHVGVVPTAVSDEGGQA